MIVTIEEEACTELIRMVMLRDASDPCVEFSQAIAGLAQAQAALRQKSLREEIEAGEGVEPSDGRFAYLDRAAPGTAGADEDLEDVSDVIDDLEEEAPEEKQYIEDDDPPSLPVGRGRYGR